MSITACDVKLLQELGVRELDERGLLCISLKID